MTLVKVVYRVRGVLKILCRLPAIIAFTVAFPSHKEFEGFTKHACVTHMVNLIFLFTFNLCYAQVLSVVKVGSLLVKEVCVRVSHVSVNPSCCVSKWTES